METVFDRFIGHGYRQDNPASRHVLKILTSTKRMKQHHRALPYAEVPTAMHKIELSTAYPLTKLAFRLLVLTATRSCEVRCADWSEVDWECATWTIPAERMSSRKEHRRPQTADRPGHGDAAGCLGHQRPRRADIPDEAEWRDDVRYGADSTIAASGDSGDGPRVQVQFQGLGH